MHPAERAAPAIQSIAFPVLVMFAASWACWIPVVTGHVPVGARGPLWLVGVFVPGLSAVAFTLWQRGLAGVRALLRPILKWRVGGRWYVFAVAFMAGVKLLVALIHRAAFGAWPRFGSESILVILAAVVLSTPAQAGEEVGWRGYLLPRLARRFGFARASIVVGVIWALWHLPQFFLRGADTYSQSFPLWTLEIVALSVALTFLYLETNGSLLLCMLMHSANNNTKDIVPSAALDARSPWSVHGSPVFLLTVLLLWVAAAGLLIRMRGTEARDSATVARDR